MIIYPFFNTGLALSVTPDDSLIIFDNQTFKGSTNIKYPKGEYPIKISRLGFETIENTVIIKSYGMTQIQTKLKKKELIKEVPYYPVNDYFWIIGEEINDEPVYEVHYFNEAEKTKAIKWLTEKGVDTNKLKVKFVLDGD